TFGEFDLVQTAEPETGSEEEELIATLNQAVREQRLVELEDQKETEGTATSHLVEPHRLGRGPPPRDGATSGRTRDAERSFRLDRMRSARLLDERFERREGFDELRPERIAARILYLPGEETRRRLERPNATELADGSALVEDGVGAEWVVGEIL